MNESTFWKIYLITVVSIMVVGFCLVCLVEPKKTETQYDVIQTIIEDLSTYQAEIESWGYQVSVLPRMEEEPPEQGYKHYYWNHAGPVLVLTDKDGGNWCFYYGFDQYFTQFSSTDSMKVYKSDEMTEVNRTIDFQMTKRWIGNPPLRENKSDSDTIAYYDVEVKLHIQAEPVEDGMELDWFNSHPHNFYCCNNFVDCSLGETSFVDMEKKTRSEDRAVKNEFSAEQLLGYYQQGLDLHDRLMQLYQEKQMD